MDYDRQQLDNYLAKSQTQSYQNVNRAQPQQPQQIQQPNQQSSRSQKPQSNVKNNQEDNFFQKFGANYDAKKNKLQRELQDDYSQYMHQVNLTFFSLFFKFILFLKESFKRSKSKVKKSAKSFR